MKKRFQNGIIFAVVGLCAALVSCPSPAGNDSPPPLTSSTLIQFVNEGAYPASVYHDPQRSSLAANVGPGGRSELLGAIPLDTATFYPSFILIIDDTEILFTPNRAIEARIDAHKTTAIPIPYLDQLYPDKTTPLVPEAYLSIKNEGGNGFRLQSGVNSLLPLGRSEVEVNDGETVVYRVSDGSAQMYEILSSAQTYPLGGYGITQFEAGHLYTLTFKGAAVTEAADQVINMDNLSPQGDLPALTGLRAQIAGAGAALTWNAAADWPRYRVYRSQSAAGVYSPITDYNLTTAAYTDNHASQETLNYYKVRGYSEDGRRMSVFSEPCALALVAPPAPAAPELTPDNGQLRAVWETHPLAERYEIYIGTVDNSSGASKKAEARDGANSVVIGGLENGTRYYVWIKAVNSAGASQISPAANGTPDAFTQPPPAPAAPTLTAGDREIAVSWQALATAASYTLWYGTDNNPANATRYAAGLTGTSAVIDGLVNGQTYYVWVQAWNRKGDGPRSPAASVKAGLPPGSPAAPSVTAGDGKLMLSWAAVPGASEYEVYYGTNTADTLFTTTSGTTATITGLVNDTSYTVRLRAKNGVGLSDFGPAANEVPWLGAPRTPSIIPGDEKLIVSWDVVPEAIAYEVYYRTYGTYETTSITTSETTATITGLVNGTKYYVYVQAIGNGGGSHFSYGPEGEGTPMIPTVKFYDGGTSEAQKIGEASLQNFYVWLSSNGKNGHSYYLVMMANDTVPGISFGFANSTVDITLMSDGTERTISPGSGATMFTIRSRMTLTLEEGVVLRGSSPNTRNLVHIDGGTLVMNGGKICDSSGGGVTVGSLTYSGTFIMNGGEISGNTVSAYGGGVYVYSGTFTMNGGKINGNTAGTVGGGVYVSNVSRFTMRGGEISGNTAGTMGGGVCVSGTFTKTSQGGVVYGNNASETLKNSAGGNGDAVFRATNSKKRNATIPANEAFDSTSNSGWD